MFMVLIKVLSWLITVEIWKLYSVFLFYFYTFKISGEQPNFLLNI